MDERVQQVVELVEQGKEFGTIIVEGATQMEVNEMVKDMGEMTMNINKAIKEAKEVKKLALEANNNLFWNYVENDLDFVESSLAFEEAAHALKELKKERMMEMVTNPKTYLVLGAVAAVTVGAVVIEKKFKVVDKVKAKFKKD